MKNRVRERKKDGKEIHTPRLGLSCQSIELKELEMKKQVCEREREIGRQRERKKEERDRQTGRERETERKEESKIE